MANTCKVESCGLVVKARGYCNLHWMRHRLGIPLSLPKYYNRIAARGWRAGGYRWLSTPDRGEIMQHRYFMEKHLGRILHVDEVVHHKNGDKLDNRLDNLEVMNRAAHTSHHRAHRIPCIVCSKDDKHGAFGLCGAHAQTVRNFAKRYHMVIPEDKLARACIYVGLAHVLSDAILQTSIERVLHGAD